MMRAINVGRQELGPDALATLGQLCNISVDPHLGQATVSTRILGLYPLFAVFDCARSILITDATVGRTQEPRR